MKAQRAIITVFCVDVNCPHCGEFIASPSGSLFFELEQLFAGDEYTCECGTVVVIPPTIKASIERRVSAAPFADLAPSPKRDRALDDWRKQ